LCVRWDEGPWEVQVLGSMVEVMVREVTLVEEEDVLMER
jgi:hypothetical protein